MSKHDYENAATEVGVLLSKIEPTIKRLSSDPRGWWQNRKRYNRLSENIAKSYVSSKLREIKMKGRSEANKFIEKLIFSKKNDIPNEMLGFIGKNRSVWADFIYKMAATLDHETLAGFFVPFIYGGVVSRKNMTGEAFGIVDFGDVGDKNAQNDRMMKAMSAISGFKQRGISIILIEGSADKIYSRQMLSLYRSSPNEAFLIVEREGKSDKNAFASGVSAYDRAVLSELCAAKNVFVLLETDLADKSEYVSDSSKRLAGKSRALSSYGILHGIWGDIDCKATETLGKGSGLIVLDRQTKLGTAVGSIQLPKRAEDAIHLIPRPIIDSLSSPTLPIRLGDLYEMLILAQFILTAGNIREIRREIV